MKLIVLGLLLLLAAGPASAAEGYLLLSTGGVDIYPGSSVAYTGAPVSWSLYFRTSQPDCEVVNYYLRVMVDSVIYRDSHTYTFTVCPGGWNSVSGGSDSIPPGTVEYIVGYADGGTLAYLGFYLTAPPTPTPTPTSYYPTPTPYYPTLTPTPAPTPTPYYPTPTPMCGPSSPIGSFYRANGQNVEFCGTGTWVVAFTCLPGTTPRIEPAAATCDQLQQTAPPSTVQTGRGAPRTPGYEAVFAVAGLLMAVYLLKSGRRNG